MRSTSSTSFSSFLFFVALPWLASCSGVPAANNAVSEAEVAALARPEAHAAAHEYRARHTTFRLFGTQGEGDEAFATLAELPSFETRNLGANQTLGRNLRLSSISEQKIVLTDAVTGVSHSVAAGQDITVSVIEHEFDRAVQEQPSHVFLVNRVSLARLVQRHGVGVSCEPVSVFAQTMCRITRVKRGSLGDRMDLRVGDLLADAGGRQITPQNVGAILGELAQPSSADFPLGVVRSQPLARLYR